MSISRLNPLIQREMKKEVLTSRTLTIKNCTVKKVNQIKLFQTYYLNSQFFFAENGIETIQVK